jgi:hypothetical protein
VLLVWLIQPSLPLGPGQASGWVTAGVLELR